MAVTPEPVSINRKKMVMYQINNPGETLELEEKISMRTSLNTAKRSALKARGYNLELIEEVQNPSGIEFHTTYFDDGMASSAIINVYDYPKNEQLQGWFKELINHKNTIVDIKIGTENKFEVQKALKQLPTPCVVRHAVR